MQVIATFCTITYQPVISGTEVVGVLEPFRERNMYTFSKNDVLLELELELKLEFVSSRTLALLAIRINQ